MIHFHAFHLLNYRDTDNIILSENTVEILAILFHYHNDHCTLSWRDALFLQGSSVCLVVLQPPDSRVSMGWRPARLSPPALLHHPEHFLTGPAPVLRGV